MGKTRDVFSNKKILHTINVFLMTKKVDSAQNISPKVALTRLAVGGTTSCRWWLRCPGGALGDTRHRRSPVPVTWTPPHLLLVFLLLLLLFLFFCLIFLPPYWISHGPFIFLCNFAILVERPSMQVILRDGGRKVGKINCRNFFNGSKLCLFRLWVFNRSPTPPLLLSLTSHRRPN